MKTKYTVINEYGISGESSHRSVVAALKNKDSRNGLGWIVRDQDGNVWDVDFDGNPVKKNNR